MAGQKNALPLHSVSLRKNELAQLNIKGVLIEAKGTGKFSQGEVLKLKITGMENGKLIVEKDIKNENLAKK